MFLIKNEAVLIKKLGCGQNYLAMLRLLHVKISPHRAEVQRR